MAYTLYVDKAETFSCAVNVDGAKLKNTSVRLVVEANDLSLQFDGTLNDNGHCEIPIRKLKNVIPEGETGKIRLEVIADDTLFTPWTESLITRLSKNVVVEAVEAPKEEEKKPIIRVTVENKNIDTYATELLEILEKNKITMENMAKRKKSLQIIVDKFTKKLPKEIIINELIENTITQLAEKSKKD